MGFDVNAISFYYADKPVLRDLSVHIRHGRFYGILGPNGSGKTTLLDVLAGIRPPAAGQVTYNGRALAAYTKKQLAREIALVPQNFYINFPFAVEDIVMMGRYPYIARFARPTAADIEAVEQVMRRTDVHALRHRFITELSGGERQRVVFARALVQATPVLMMDEATSNLDIRHTIDLLNLVAAKVKQEGGTAVAVFQDINLAAIYCDDLIFLKNGAVAAQGAKADVLNAATIRTVFEVDSKIAFEPYIDACQVVFRR